MERIFGGVDGSVTSAAIDWLTPAARMPWPVEAPFRMRPNLEKLDVQTPALLLRDELADVYLRERSKVLATHSDRAVVGQADAAVLARIRALATTGESKGAAAGASALQEDFVILKQEAETLHTEYLSVCFPSRWDPREKLGLDFSAIHAPVADNQLLQAAGPNLMTLAFMKQPMLRHVWLISPSASLDQHPDKNEAWWAEAIADASPLLPRLYFRVERQTTWPLPQFQRAVFFIRVMMCQLLDVLSVGAGRASELAATLRSMTPAIVAYRGMTDALPRLLAELDATP
ncbi:MAG: heme-dependent oxidative N-demethylase subunit alpha family protein [Casimicrobium sp.]